MREVIELSGFAELEAKLRDLPKATGKNVLRRIGKGALGADGRHRVRQGSAPERQARVQHHGKREADAAGEEVDDPVRRQRIVSAQRRPRALRLRWVRLADSGR
jgi:hypothetical protein